jgi:hypothetical protein
MASPLVIPGVQVKTVFEPSPVLPGATGILGVVGVADRGPLEATPVGNMSEFVDAFGPASRYTMPEVRTALANGVAEVVVARTSPQRGQKAVLTLLDDDGEQVARLVARAEGRWGNSLGARVTQVRTLSGAGIKYFNLEISLGGQVIETFNNLVMDERSPNYFFDRVNDGSAVVVAVDPLFEAELPSAFSEQTLAEEEARAASVLLTAGDSNVVSVEAKRAGATGNLTAILVEDGHAGLALTGAADAASVDLRARAAGAAGANTRVSVVAAPNDSVNLVVTAPPAGARNLGPFASVDEIVAALESDPDVAAVKQGDALPSVLGSTALNRRVDVTVVREGRDPAVHTDLETLDDISSISNTLVSFEAVGGATQLPDANEGAPLVGGRNKGAALALVGESSDSALLEITPRSGAPSGLALSGSRGVSSVDQATAVLSLSVHTDGTVVESFANLTMDPDDAGYLPNVLDDSALIQAFDLFVRSRTTSIPRHQARPQSFADGTSPLVDDYQAALDRLEMAEQVDLVIPSTANQLDDADIISVQQAVVAHCTKMADVARNRIGLGSVTTAESDSTSAMLSHADDVRSDHFILAAPAGVEAAVAGLLGRQDYFRSPTFKTIASPGVPPGGYTDSQLRQLILGNVLVVNKKRGLGVIAVKGLLTSGRQVNVQRTANKAVRDVKAICDVYIGLLNNDGARNALKQQITALLLQMERDGALVPSTDGADPAFKVDVYSTQADFANGIVRVDIAVRPVRAIDFIYATILVQN